MFGFLNLRAFFGSGYVTERNLAGVVGSVFEVLPASGGSRKPSRMTGARPPHIFEVFKHVGGFAPFIGECLPEPPGAGKTSNAPPKSGQIAFKYPNKGCKSQVLQGQVPNFAGTSLQETYKLGSTSIV